MENNFNRIQEVGSNSMVNSQSQSEINELNRIMAEKDNELKIYKERLKMQEEARLRDLEKMKEINNSKNIEYGELIKESEVNKQRKSMYYGQNKESISPNSNKLDSQESKEESKKSKKKTKGKKNNKKDKKSKTIPKTVQQSIPYYAVYEDLGVIEIERGIFTKSYALQDINYQIARQDDRVNIFLRYGEFLNSFDSSVKFQITINNRNIDQKEFEENTYLKYKNDHLDEYRSEYNQMFKRRLMEGRNNISRERYLTVSVQADSIDSARSTFLRLDTEIIENVKKIGQANVSPLSTIDRLEILHDIYNVGSEGSFNSKVMIDGFERNTFSFKDMKKQGLTTKDCIAPSSLQFKPDYIMIGDKYARSLFLSKVPTYLNDKIIAELTDMDCNMLTTMNFKSVNQTEAIKAIERHIFNVEASIGDRQRKRNRDGAGMIPTKLIQQREDAEEWIEALTKLNQKMFLMSLVFVIFADTLEELDDNTELLLSKARGSMCNVKKFTLQQESGFNSTLPLANNQVLVNRSFTTEGASVFMPFSSQELTEKDGLYYGVNAISRNMIMYDRRNGMNYNGFILGTSGSGKSFFAKREMVNVLLNTDDDVIVIDPEREYAPLAELFGGEVIRIAPGSGIHINPMDMDSDYADNDNPIAFKAEFMLSLCEAILGGSQGLGPIHKSIIDRTTIMAYSEYVNKGFDIKYIPTLTDFHRLLGSQPEKESQELAVALELYTSGSLDIFAHKTNVPNKGRFIVYDIKDMGTNVKTLSMLTVLDSIWNRMISNRKKGKRTWFYIDEIYLLFTNEISANYLQSIYKRARKWDGVPTGITQNIEDLLKTDVARTMLSNSEFIAMLNQAPLDRDELAKLLNISDTQLSYITNADIGEGLIYTGKFIVPFLDKFPNDTKLYQAMTTKASEVNKKYR